MAQSELERATYLEVFREPYQLWESPDDKRDQIILRRDLTRSINQEYDEAMND